MRPNLISAVRLALLSAVICIPGIVRAQAGESDLRVFGYLQASFYQEVYREVYSGEKQKNANTFTVQQLDIMMQKNLGRRWSAFVDLLLTNNYSSFRSTGTLDLEQAWVRYRRSHYLNIKGGLLIPRFNYLNEIKNKMPVLPYIIRPIVYETSFQEDIFLEEYVPQRAFLQVYGYAPAGDYKIDYAGYLGNSPNINRDRQFGQTGLDTTGTFLTGGRIGIRHNSFQAGFSATFDKVDYLDTLEPDTLTPPLVFEGINRVRLGGDVLAEYRKFKLEGEYIAVEYDEDPLDINNDKRFFYGTLGYQISDKLFAYASYWQVDQYFNRREGAGFQAAKLKLEIPTGGVAYQVSDRITLKGAAARVRQQLDFEGYGKRVFHFYTVAVSVMF